MRPAAAWRGWRGCAARACCAWTSGAHAWGGCVGGPGGAGGAEGAGPNGAVAAHSSPGRPSCPTQRLRPAGVPASPAAWVHVPPRAGRCGLRAARPRAGPARTAPLCVHGAGPPGRQRELRARARRAERAGRSDGPGPVPVRPVFCGLCSTRALTPCGSPRPPSTLQGVQVLEAGLWGLQHRRNGGLRWAWPGVWTCGPARPDGGLACGRDPQFICYQAR